MSDFLKLNVKDFIKGLIVSVISAVLTIISTTVQAGNFTFDWKQIGIVALTAGVAYITKNFLTNSDGKLGK
jgi:hypothetical protein